MLLISNEDGCCLRKMVLFLIIFLLFPSVYDVALVLLVTLSLSLACYNYQTIAHSTSLSLPLSPPHSLSHPLPIIPSPTPSPTLFHPLYPLMDLDHSNTTHISSTYHYVLYYLPKNAHNQRLVLSLWLAIHPPP